MYVHPDTNIGVPDIHAPSVSHDWTIIIVLEFFAASTLKSKEFKWYKPNGTQFWPQLRVVIFVYFFINLFFFCQVLHVRTAYHSGTKAKLTTIFNVSDKFRFEVERFE